MASFTNARRSGRRSPASGATAPVGDTAAPGPGHLAMALFHGAVWFDQALNDRLAARGQPHHTWTRSLLYTQLDQGSARMSDLAVTLGISRQAAHKLVDALVADGLVERDVDPADGRAQRVALTAGGRAHVHEVRGLLIDLEVELERRVGAASLAALRSGLATDPGPPPDSSLDDG